MFKLESNQDKFVMPSEVDIKELFNWLPHENSIIVVKKVHAASADWGLIELDIDKMLDLDIFLNNELPIEYSIELMAQAVGLTGAAQSYLNISDVKQAKKVFVTGFRNLNFYYEKIPLKKRTFVEILETKSFEGFKFCNCQIFQYEDDNLSPEYNNENLDQNLNDRKVISEGTLKAFIVYK